MTTDFGLLDTAATGWDKVAEELKKVEGRYKSAVLPITIGSGWVGVSAIAANRRFVGTHYEYLAAQTQAKATAKVLRAGRERFAELKKILESARADAVAAGMKVSEQGRVAYDYDRLTGQERADLQADSKALQSVKENEGAWAEYIDACVKSFDEADKDLKASLETVVTDTIGGGNANDMTFGSGFNGQAKGDMIAATPPKAEDEVSLDLSSLMMDPKTETLSTWSARAQGDIVARLSGNPEWGKLYSRYVSGAVSLAAFARATGITVPGAFALINAYRKPGTLLNAPGTLTARLIGGSPNIPGAANALNASSAARSVLGGSNAVAAQYGSYMKNGALITPTTAAQANLITVAESGGLANAAKAAGAMRGLGIVGSAGATLYGVANLSTYDSEKIANNPDKFASDLTGTAFNATLTAAMVAPNPVTVGLAVGTGVIYAGALAWENRENIADAWNTSTDWAGDKAEDLGKGIASGASKVGKFLNPFD
ncbi:hypothetical protein OG264_19210 [Streptomyces xanthophaeus]|uniref:hypothetical protein n=1 Tax=Streptomyces xanthophaeus TaxID=67385 RepID=UPI003869467C|nr:hypothetical protein OG264_19210 [Streptomyces xanthophaeus]WST61578.1 hypothetical protein OG605_19225 [Streptomyces xanthophaeus]